jgi:murein DD-endopeptidase MepM/ murein hydrolase activator NlpD
VIGTADGTVSFVGPNGDYGLTVQVDHGDGLTTVFCHLDSALVRVGDPVRRGTSVGTVGNTGRTTGPHLHYEVWLAGRPVDPSRYILTLTAIVD